MKSYHLAATAIKVTTRLRSATFASTVPPMLIANGDITAALHDITKATKSTIQLASARFGSKWSKLVLRLAVS